MGYHTEFKGSFTIDRPVDEETYELLRGLGTTRRMKRRVSPKYGMDGEFYVKDDDEGIVDYNTPPIMQPGLWCDWLIQEDRQTIEWDGSEKFYCYVDWLEYLILAVLEPRGYKLSGTVCWRGEAFCDVGAITVKDNKFNTISMCDTL